MFIVQGLNNRITKNVLFGKFGRIRKISCTENGICIESELMITGMPTMPVILNK